MKKKSSFCLFSSVLRFPPQRPPKIRPVCEILPRVSGANRYMIPPNKTDYKKFFLHDLQLFFENFSIISVFWKLEHQTELSDEAFIHSLRPFVQRLLGYRQK